MKSMHESVSDYIAVRRSLGFKLERHKRLLLDFASYLRQAKSDFISTNLAVQWASKPGVSANTAAWRLGVVRGFAEFAQTVDPRNEVPSSEWLPFRKGRPLPYIYSRADIRDLLDSLQSLRTSHPFIRFTYSTFFGLLAVTGMRVGEAIALDRTDFDSCDGVLTIRCAKFGKSREVPVHATTGKVLREYERKRDRLFPRPKCPAFFLSTNGTRLLCQNVSVTFDRARRVAGLSQRRPRPRIHDLRHSFAVNTLCDWYRAGQDVEAKMPLLSTYLGHVAPASTYWYLTSVPGLLGLAARYLEKAMGELP